MRVWISRVSPRVIPYSKASEGVEKSLPKGRRKRGLRKGKSRSREGKSRRSTPITAPDSKKSSARIINHKGRKLIWIMAAQTDLDRRLRKVDTRPGLGSIRYIDGQRRFRALSRYASRTYIPPGASEHPGTSFKKYLDRLWPTGQALDDFSSLLRQLRSRSPEAEPAGKSELPSSIREVIVNGETDYLCSYCHSVRRVDKHGLTHHRRVCNINDTECLLRKREDASKVADLPDRTVKTGRYPRRRGRGSRK